MCCPALIGLVFKSARGASARGASVGADVPYGTAHCQDQSQGWGSGLAMPHHASFSPSARFTTRLTVL